MKNSNWFQFCTEDVSEVKLPEIEIWMDKGGRFFYEYGLYGVPEASLGYILGPFNSEQEALEDARKNK